MATLTQSNLTKAAFTLAEYVVDDNLTDNCGVIGPFFLCLHWTIAPCDSLHSVANPLTTSISLCLFITNCIVYYN